MARSLRRARWVVQLAVMGVVLAMSIPVSGADSSETVSPENLSQERIAEHQSFRSNYDFLSNDSDHIAQLITSGDVSPQALDALGLELSDEEWTEFERRQNLLDKVVPIKRLVTGLPLDDESEDSFGSTLITEGERPRYGDLFSGIWLDQMDGGRLKLAVTDASKVDLGAIHALLDDAADDLVVIEQKYSRDELEAFKRKIGEAITATGADAATGYDYTDSGIQIRVIPKHAKVDIQPLVKEIPEDVYVISDPHNYVLGGAPHTTHSSGDQQSGLQIGIWDTATGFLYQGCTWGVTGHTASYTYIVTAGHCFTADGSVLSGWAHRWATQNISGNEISTTPNAFVYARAYDSSADFDHGRISSPAANTNCYHYAGHCTRKITERISLYAHEVGQTVCATLASDDSTAHPYDCGTVVDADYNDGGLTNRVEVDSMDGHPGDSGAGLFYLNNFHGILTHVNEVESRILFEPAYWVKAYIGASTFDFNCVTSGSWWDSCPISYSN